MLLLPWHEGRRLVVLLVAKLVSLLLVCVGIGGGRVGREVGRIGVVGVRGTTGHRGPQGALHRQRGARCGGGPVGWSGEDELALLLSDLVEEGALGLGDASGGFRT